MESILQVIRLSPLNLLRLLGWLLQGAGRIQASHRAADATFRRDVAVSRFAAGVSAQREEPGAAPDSCHRGARAHRPRGLGPSGIVRPGAGVESAHQPERRRQAARHPGRDRQRVRICGRQPRRHSIWQQAQAAVLVGCLPPSPRRSGRVRQSNASFPGLKPSSVSGCAPCGCING